MKEKEIMKEGPIWTESYPVLSSLINQRGLKIGAEIGVAFGGHIEHILKNTKTEKIYAIDPYKHIWGYDDPMNLSPQKFNELFESTKKRLSPFGNRVVFLRNKSKEAISDVKETLDFVYIDADHSYQGAKNDILLWFNKVRDGGIIAGHDYDHPNFPGVKKAVHECFERFGWKINSEKGTVWWVEKKPIHISFIMPAFNCAKTVEQSILSILETNLKENDEVIIVDDKSTDNTLEILKKIASKYKNIKVIEHAENKGGGSARNTAVKNTKNELIFCLDSDNVLEKNSIEKLKNFLISSGSDVSSFQELKFFTENISQTTHSWKYDEGVISLLDMFCSSILPPASGNYLFTRKSWEKAGGYPESAGALDTWGFGFKQLATGSVMMPMPGSYYFHRVGLESYWVRESKNKEKVSIIAANIVNIFPEATPKEVLDYVNNNKENWFYNIGNIPNISSIKTGKVVRSLKTKIMVTIKKLVPYSIKVFIKKILKKIEIETPLPKPSPEEKNRIENLRNQVKSLKPITQNTSLSKAENEWNKNILSLRKKILSKDPRNFLKWDVVISTMFFKGNDSEISYLQKRIDWPVWQKAIKESSVGNPIPYKTYSDSSSNLIHHAYSLSHFLSDCNVDIKNLSSVFEFGGGYGSMARLFYNLGFSNQYIIFDLPEFTFLQEFFLKSLGSDLKISRIPSKFKNKEVLLMSDIKILQEQIKMQKVDLVIGTWSLSEAPIYIRDSVLNSISKPKYYLIAFQNKFNEVDNKIYFDEFIKIHPEYEWNLSVIEYLPGNYYLFGQLK